MPKVKVTQASFAAGELSPSLHARHDLAKYMVGLKSCRNFMVLPHGPVAKTPGTYIVAEAKVKDKAGRLIPFQFSTVQAYALWFEHLVMRVVKDGGLVVYPDGHALAGQVVEVASPYTAGELQRLSFAQSADVLYLAHPNHPPKKLSRTDHHEWTFGNVNFTPSIAPPHRAICGINCGRYGQRVGLQSGRRERRR